MKQKEEIIRHAQNDDDDLGQYAISDEDKMRLYDCGHAFHIECIKKYIREQMVMEQTQKGAVQSKQVINPKNIKITKALIDKQRCPWCYSEKFKIDLESIFSQNQARKGGALVQGRGKIGVSNKPDEVDDDLGFEDEEDNDESMNFDEQRIGSFRNGSSFRRHKRDAKFTGSMIQRG